MVCFNFSLVVITLGFEPKSLQLAGSAFAIFKLRYKYVKSIVPAIDDTEYNILAYIVNNVNGGYPNYLWHFLIPNPHSYYPYVSTDYQDFGDSFEQFTSLYYQREVTPAECEIIPISLSVSQGLTLFPFLEIKS